MSTGPRRSTRNDSIEIRFLEGVYRRGVMHGLLLEALGALYTRVGRFTDGLRMDQQMVRQQPTAPLAWYNLACSHALLEQTAAALLALEHAIELGYTDAAWMMKDSDLESLHAEPAFRRLVARCLQAGTP